MTDAPIAAADRIAACTDLIRSGQSLYDAYVWRAAAYADSGDPAAAIADLTAAIALAPDAPAAYSARGALFLKDEEYRDGLVDLDRALAIAPDDETTLRTRAFAWDELANYAAAIADYSRLIALTADPSYRYFRGFAYFHADNDSAALADFNAIIASVSPTLSAWGYRGRGNVRERNADLVGALDDYSKALAVDPSDDRSFAARCRVENALGEGGAEGCAPVLRQTAGR
ncbi:MAG TPA: hypothetical protein VG894_07765 [Bauldia sp.]|nr:hypothetical protein [Bauldia sp.]